MLDVHRGTWKVGVFRRWVTITVQLVLVYQAAARGADYLGAKPASAASGLVRAETSAPFGLGLTFWGLIFIGAALVFCAGFAFRWWSFIAAAHFVIAFAYFAVSYGLFAQAFEAHYWQGIRTPSGLLAAMVVHMAMGFDTAALSRQSQIRREGTANE